MRPRTVQPHNPAHHRLATEYQARLRGRALRLLRDGDAADECVQQSFLNFFERWPGEPPQKPEAYLFQILRREVIDHLRRRFKVVLLPQMEELEAREEDETSRLIDRLHQIDPQAVPNAIRRLPPRHAALMWAKYVDLKSTDDLVRDFKLGSGEVYKRLCEGRALLNQPILSLLAGAP